MRLLLILLAFLGFFLSCSSGSNDDQNTTKQSTKQSPPNLTNDNLAIPNNTQLDEYKILIFGNSHVLELNSLLQSLFEHSLEGKSVVKMTVSVGDFLAERLEDGRSLELLKSEDWTHVILQGQKYSQSGQVDYPTIAAQIWLQQIKAQQAMPILFPEHPQKGRYQEAQRVHNLHLRIAQQQLSCVAPVGLVWDRVIALWPTLSLHQPDGNHASYAGKFLTALVFYQVISGKSADLLPYIEDIEVSAYLQDFMGQITSEVLAEHPACEF
ncbi:hypothetical protein [Paraglaciecola aestuariivivens]